MKGLVWDDLDEMSLLNRSSIMFYENLKKAFLKEDVSLRLCKVFDDFLDEFTNERYDFALIDLMRVEDPRTEAKGAGARIKGSKVGVEYAAKIRKLAAEHERYGDDSFPIFLISRDLGKASLDQLADLQVHWLDKAQQPSLIVHAVKMVLRPHGRWIPGSQSFIIARMGGVSYSGQRFDDSNFRLLQSMSREAGLEPNLLEKGAVLDRDLMERINSKLLASRKIVTLITCDEQLEGSTDPGFMSRPNIYLELGLVAARASTLRRTLLLVQKGVAFPSDFGGKLRLDFENSLEEVRKDVMGFLMGEP